MVAELESAGVVDGDTDDIDESEDGAKDEEDERVELKGLDDDVDDVEAEWIEEKDKDEEDAIEEDSA